MTEKSVWVKSTAPSSAAFRVKVKEMDLIDDLKKAIAAEMKLAYGSPLLAVKQTPHALDAMEVDAVLQFAETGGTDAVIGSAKQIPYYFTEPVAAAAGKVIVDFFSLYLFKYLYHSILFVKHLEYNCSHLASLIRF
jgi:hypothetical protein